MRKISDIRSEAVLRGSPVLNHTTQALLLSIHVEREYVFIMCFALSLSTELLRSLVLRSNPKLRHEYRKFVCFPNFPSFILRRWCSGIMQDSHSCDPGSIPGRRTLLGLNPPLRSNFIPSTPTGKQAAWPSGLRRWF